MTSDSSDGEFRLEDDKRDAIPAASPRQPARSMSTPPPAVPIGGSEEEHQVSAIPVRERNDPASRTRPGRLPPPRGWPGEALRYPVRGRGVASLVLGAAVLASFDQLTRWNAFLGLFAKVLVLVWVLRWQMRATVATAGGDDRPPRAFDGADFEGDALSSLLGVLVRLVVYLIPAAVAYAKPFLQDPKDGAHDAASWTLVIGLGSLALLLAPIVVLGAATGNRRMTWPWGAVPWLFRGFRVCLAVTLGWAALVPAEAFVTWLPATSLGLSFAACFALRTVSLEILLAGARGLGVLGRRFEL